MRQLSFLWRFWAAVAALAAVAVLLAAASVRGEQATVPEQAALSDVLILGDSLCVFARGSGNLAPQMDSAFDSHDTICKVGGNLSWGREQIQALEAVPGTVVVELGTNRMPNLTVFANEHRGLMADLRARGAERVVWLTAHTRGTTLYYSQNDIVRDTAAELDYLVSDWATLAEQHGEWYLSDTVHHTSSGMAALSVHLRDAAMLAHRSTESPGASGPVLDAAKMRSDGQVTLIGWVDGQGGLMVMVDGLSVSSFPIETFSRPDVEASLNTTDHVGFKITVAVPANGARVCVAVPGQVPGGSACQSLR